jgi:hypothetical protein
MQSPYLCYGLVNRETPYCVRVLVFAKICLTSSRLAQFEPNRMRQSILVQLDREEVNSQIEGRYSLAYV